MQNEYSQLWHEVRNILVNAISATEAKSRLIQQYQDRQYLQQKSRIQRIIEYLLDALEYADEMCFNDKD